MYIRILIALSSLNLCFIILSSYSPQIVLLVTNPSPPPYFLNDLNQNIDGVYIFIGLIEVKFCYIALEWSRMVKAN